MKRENLPSVICLAGAVTVALTATGVAAVTLPEYSVGTAQLRDQAVTNPKLANGSVGNLKLRDGAVTTQKIANGTIDAVDLSWQLWNDLAQVTGQQGAGRGRDRRGPGHSGPHRTRGGDRPHRTHWPRQRHIRAQRQRQPDGRRRAGR